MEFEKYQHIERFGVDEVEGIENGTCHVFPKIDGTNSQLWMEDGILKAGSRNRTLEIDNDNAGFYAWALEQETFKRFFKDFPMIRLYGEWLVPHTLKTYRDDAWRKFYVFDVIYKGKTVCYDEYSVLLEPYDINYIPCIAKVKNGDYERFVGYLERNDFLIKDGCGSGEGIVIKNYNFTNRFGRQTWAKIVKSEFKEKHMKLMGSPDVEFAPNTEQKIVGEFLTDAFIEKEYCKIKTEHDGWKSQYIMEFFGRVQSEFIKEETWNIVKKMKYPTINFKTLNFLITEKIKTVMPELF